MIDVVFLRHLFLFVFEPASDALGGVDVCLARFILEDGKLWAPTGRGGIRNWIDGC